MLKREAALTSPDTSRVRFGTAPVGDVTHSAVTISFLASEVGMPLRFRHAVLVDESAFLGRDRFPANGAGDRLRLPEEHRDLLFFDHSAA